VSGVAGVAKRSSEMFRPMMIAAAAVALATPAAAQLSRPQVSLAQAVAAAEQELGARAFDAEFEMDRGDMVYEVELVRNGRPIHALVDANSGRVVHHATPLAGRLPWRGDHLKAAQSAPRTLSQTIAMVEEATRGRVSDIGLERRGGRHYYEIELVGAQDREVLVDVRTGAITPLLGD
jgi:uncharacterized membrane protein YkoI